MAGPVSSQTCACFLAACQQTFSLVELEGRAVCVKQALPQLKVTREWLAPVSRAFAEIEWLRTAATLIPGHVPGVLAVDECNSAFIMEYLPTGEYPNWKADLLAGRVDPQVGAQVGDLLGRMHFGTSTDPDAARRFAYGANFFALRWIRICWSALVLIRTWRRNSSVWSMQRRQTVTPSYMAM